MFHLLKGKSILYARLQFDVLSILLYHMKLHSVKFTDCNKLIIFIYLITDFDLWKNVCRTNSNKSKVIRVFRVFTGKHNVWQRRFKVLSKAGNKVNKISKKYLRNSFCTRMLFCVYKEDDICFRKSNKSSNIGM